MVKFVPRREKIFLQSDRAFLASTPYGPYLHVRGWGCKLTVWIFFEEVWSIAISVDCFRWAFSLNIIIDRRVLKTITEIRVQLYITSHKKNNGTSKTTLFFRMEVYAIQAEHLFQWAFVCIVGGNKKGVYSLFIYLNDYSHFYLNLMTIVIKSIFQDRPWISHIIQKVSAKVFDWCLNKRYLSWKSTGIRTTFLLFSHPKRTLF